MIEIIIRTKFKEKNKKKTKKKQKSFQLTIYCPRALLSASCSLLEANWPLSCHLYVDMANHLNAKLSQNRTSSNAGYLMIKSSKKIAFHTIKVTK